MRIKADDRFIKYTSPQYAVLHNQREIILITLGRIQKIAIDPIFLHELQHTAGIFILRCFGIIDNVLGIYGS